MRYSTFVSCLFFLGVMLLFSLLPVLAHASTNATDITMADVAPPPDLVAKIGSVVAGGLALIWAMRKIIKLINKS